MAKKRKKAAVQENTGGFRQNVRAPGQYLAVYIILLLFFVAMAVLVLTAFPSREKDFECRQLCFGAYEVEDGDLVLYGAEDGARYVVRDYAETLPDSANVTAYCDAATTFTAWTRYCTPEDKEAYYKLGALWAGETELLSFQAVRARERRDCLKFLCFMIIPFLFVNGIMLLVYLVGRDPQRFPRWVVRLCFKSGEVACLPYEQDVVTSRRNRPLNNGARLDAVLWSNLHDEKEKDAGADPHKKS
ncbi:MAG: hypothetical protein IJ357_00920 [Oscillospiraceae bacterium]|nr:hypothetical protein [Oscillospiraceae bacterium]